jgi:hypothetical protein
MAFALRGTGLRGRQELVSLVARPRLPIAAFSSGSSASDPSSAAGSEVAVTGGAAGGSKGAAGWSSGHGDGSVTVSHDAIANPYEVFLNPRNRIQREQESPLDTLSRARPASAPRPIHLASLRSSEQRPEYITPLGPRHSSVFLKRSQGEASTEAEQIDGEDVASRPEVSITRVKREEIQPATFSLAARLGLVVRDVRLIHVAAAELESLAPEDKILRFKMLVLGSCVPFSFRAGTEKCGKPRSVCSSAGECRLTSKNLLHHLACRVS